MICLRNMFTDSNIPTVADVYFHNFITYVSQENDLQLQKKYYSIILFEHLQNLTVASVNSMHFLGEITLTIPELRQRCVHHQISVNNYRYQTLNLLSRRRHCPQSSLRDNKHTNSVRNAHHWELLFDITYRANAIHTHSARYRLTGGTSPSRITWF